MAQLAKNGKSRNTGTTYVTIYTVPVGKFAIIQSIMAANISSPEITTFVYVRWTDASDANNATMIANKHFLNTRTTEECIVKTFNLEVGDAVQVKAEDASSIDYTISVLEVDL